MMKPKYKINCEFFKTIDTENKAYFLGILYADGYIHDKRKTISLSLQEDDVDILIKLKNAIETNKPLQYIKKEEGIKNQFRLVITRASIYNDIKKWGLYQNKSLTITPKYITNLNDELLRHFLRGYYDGDGSITYYKVRNTVNSTVSIACTIEFYSFFSDFIYKKLNIKTIKGKRFKDNSNCYDLRICGNRRVIKFLSFIYKDSNIFMDRKKIKFIDFQNIHKCLNRDMGNRVVIIQDNNTVFYSYRSASKFNNIPLQTFKRHLKLDKNYLGSTWEIKINNEFQYL